MTGFRRFPTGEALADAAADLVAERALRSVRERGRFLLVLSGGATPAALYDRLAARPGYPWERTHVFWGDERCVPAGDPGSNRTLAEERLLSKVGVSREHVHPAPVAIGTSEQAARRWEAELRAFFGTEVSFPAFDLVLLGVGRDGHTASLFPGHPALEERERWAVAVDEPAASPAVPRVTLTLPVINRARCVLFLAGQEKESVVSAIREETERTPQLPAARIRPEGDLFWYMSGKED